MSRACRIPFYCEKCGGELVPTLGSWFICLNCKELQKASEETYKNMEIRKFAELCKEYEVYHVAKLKEAIVVFRPNGMVEIYQRKYRK